jgi:hypothetical protein
MKNGSITRFKLDPKKPPETDWRSFDAMSEEERHRAALSDPDAAPATEASFSALAVRRARLAQETEPDAGGIRGAVPPPARHGSGLGARRASSRPSGPCAAHSN